MLKAEKKYRRNAAKSRKQKCVKVDLHVTAIQDPSQHKIFTHTSVPSRSKFKAA